MLGMLRIKVVTTFYRRVVLMVRWTDLDEQPPSAPSSFRFDVLSDDDLGTYRELRPDAAPAEIEARLAKGDRCVALWDGADLVQAAWSATGPGPFYVPYLRRDMILEASDVCLYDSFTPKERRGAGLAQVRDGFSRLHFAALGFRRAVALVAVENQAGLRTLEPVRYRAIGIYRVVLLGPWQGARCEPFGSEAVLPLRRPTA